MRLYVQRSDEAEANNQWIWVLESNDGKILARGLQGKSTKEGCEKQLKAILAALPTTKISERPTKPLSSLRIPPAKSVVKSVAL